MHSQERGSATELRPAFPYSRTVRRIFSTSLLILLVVVSIVGCKKKESNSQSSGSGSDSGSYQALSLSEAQVRYGISPTRNSQVTYQDDVIVVEHGENAIHGVSSDGLSVTIDANLPEAQSMQPGKIAFLTSRAVGRILGTQRNGNDLSLILGPVDITEVIHDADLSYDQPVNFDAMTAYSAPDFPGADIQAPQLSGKLNEPPRKLNVGGNSGNAVAVSYISSNGDWKPLGGSRYSSQSESQKEDSFNPAIWTGKDVAAVRKLAASFAAPQIPGSKSPAPAPSRGAPSLVSIGDFKLTPFCCGGIGIKIVHDTDAVKVIAYAVLRLQNPKLHFDLKISGGKVQKAGVTLDGAAGLTMSFEAGSNVGVDGNISKQITLPVDLSIPIVGLPVPVALTLHQSFILKTAFSAKNATLKATGDYGFTGSLFMGYDNGQWTVSAPTTFSIKQSMLDSISGASVGVNGLVLAYQGKAIVGIGAFGFATGPYVGYIASIGVSRGSDLSAMLVPPCRGATLDISMSVGIGYVIPQPVTDAINFILRRLNVSEIQRSGGPEHRELLIHKEQYAPDGCEKR